MRLDKDMALVSPVALESWFNKFQQTIQATDPTIFTSLGHIFNADETGFAFNTKTCQIETNKGSKKCL
ncbi:jerky protein [Biomphalaria glabrata]|nr:jerky protein [Biomphalaria glabrata]